MRRITALTALLTLIIEIINSVILYIVPQGRIAYWADWRLWGMTKTQWTNIHINVGILFFLALFLHIYYNWKPITFYLKNKVKQIKVFTREFNIALILTAVFTVGTLVEVPPFSTIIDFSDSIKDEAAREYGEPPYGHAELSSLKTFASKMGIDIEEGLERLKKAGYQVENEKQTLKDTAMANSVSPQKIYKVMQPEAPASAVFSGEAKKLPDSPPTGMGNLTLADLCGKYNLNLKTVIRGLGDRGFKAVEEKTIKQIATDNNKSPVDVYDVIKEISTEEPPASPTHTSGEGGGSGMGLGKMTLAEVCQKHSLDESAIIEKLKAEGIKADPNETMKNIANQHETTPYDLLELIK